MCSGRLSSPACLPFESNLNPNLVAITTCPRKGERASPTSSSFVNGHERSGGRFSRIEERYAAFDGCPNKRDHLLLVRCRAVAITHSHAAEPEGRDFQAA